MKLGMGKCRHCGYPFKENSRIVEKDGSIYCEHDGGESSYCLKESSYTEKQKEIFHDDILQPYLESGQVNPEFAKRYPKSEFLTKKV